MPSIPVTKRKRANSVADVDCVLNVNQFEDTIPTINQLRESVLRFGGTVIHIQKWLSSDGLPNFFITFATAAQARHVVESMGNRIRWVDNKDIWHWGAIQNMEHSSIRYYRLPELLRRVDLTGKQKPALAAAPKPPPTTSVARPSGSRSEKDISVGEKDTTTVSTTKRRRRSTAGPSRNREVSQVVPNPEADATNAINVASPENIDTNPSHPHTSDSLAPSDPSLPLSESLTELSTTDKSGLEPGIGPGPAPRLEPEAPSAPSLDPGPNTEAFRLQSFSRIMESCESQLAAAAAETRYWRDQAEHWKQQRELQLPRPGQGEAVWRERAEEWEARYNTLRTELEMETFSRQAAEEALDRARYFALQQTYNAEMEREGRLTLEDLYTRRTWGPMSL